MRNGGHVALEAVSADNAGNGNRRGKAMSSTILGTRMKKRLACALAILATPVLATTADAATTLDTTNPFVNFIHEGGQPFTPGPTLTLNDTSVGDFKSFFARDVDAAPGIDIDVVATFQILPGNISNGAELGNRLVINDGTSHAAIASSITKNYLDGIGLRMAGGANSDPASYPVFVPVEHSSAPVTIRLRRTAAGDAELVEVNGVAPNPRAVLPAHMLPGITRALPSVEFGTSVEAVITVEYSAFRSERVVKPVAGALNLTSLRLGDPDSGDRIALRGDYALGATSGGIDPAGEPVTVTLSTPFGQFYPAPGVNPLQGFDVDGAATKRRWTLNDGERARTGIDQLTFDEAPANGGGVSLRDRRAGLPDADYSTVNVEITIGTGATADKLTGTASLVETREGSGSWRLQE
jgi:hypothetical protein